MDVWIVKMISLFVILLLTLLFGLLPIRMVAWIRRREYEELATREGGTRVGSSKHRRALGYLNCISGGVFLAVCLVHLLPEVIDEYEAVLQRRAIHVSYPLPEIFVAAGFFLIMLIEHGAMSCRRGADERRARGRHVPSDTEPLMGSAQLATPSRSSYQVDVSPVAGSPALARADVDSYESYHVCETSAPHHHHPGQTHSETVRVHAIRSLVLLLALSVHTIFEGLALGLEASTTAVWTLLAALAIHKSVIAFTMGLQLADTFQQTSRVLSYVLVFSTMSPIGIAIGTAITAVNDGSCGLDVSSMTLQGVATGTFLYVTFFEILQKELGVEDHSITKVLAIMSGFTLMSLTKLLEA